MNNLIPESVNKYQIKLGLSLNYRGETIFSFNEDMVFPAASLVKIPLSLLILKKYQEKKLDLDQEIEIDKKVPGAGIIKDLTINKYKIKDLLTLTLIISDNTASNTLINLTSFEEINKFIKSLNLQHTCLNRKFMVDLINPPVNFTTAKEMNLIFLKLLKNEILNLENTILFFDILSRQQYREKIPLFLNNNLIICNKTGDISAISHDTAVIFLNNNIQKSIIDKNYYILTILTNFPEQVNRNTVNNIIGEISLRCYERIGGKQNVHTNMG